MQISFYTITRFFEDNFHGKIRQDVAWTTSSLNNFKGDTGRSYIRNPEVVLRSNDSRRVRPRGRFWSVIIDCKQVLQPRWKRLQHREWWPVPGIPCYDNLQLGVTTPQVSYMIGAHHCKLTSSEFKQDVEMWSCISMVLKTETLETKTEDQ